MNPVRRTLLASIDIAMAAVLLQPAAARTAAIDVFEADGSPALDLTTPEPGNHQGSVLVVAEADGPDFWQVTGVPPGDSLNIRSGPGTGYRVIAEALNGQRFRNLGCRGSGSSRWCKIETRNGSLRGWVSGHYLREAGSAGSNNVPELAVRSTGEIEMRWAAGCTVLYNADGKRLQSGSSCSKPQRHHSDDAVARYMREQGASDQAIQCPSMDMRGFGNVTLGGPLTGRVLSKNGHSYALILTATRDGFTCTGSFHEPPGGHGAISAIIRCTNGATGSAVLKGKLLTFSAGGKGGLVRFR